MSEENPVRKEFGVERLSCSCKACSDSCRFVPGYLIPSDLGRMIPEGEDPFAWAEGHLLASSGGVLADSRTGAVLRIPTLVPKSKSPSDPSCIFFQGERCTIHAVSPFGCAFFKTCDKGDEYAIPLSRKGLLSLHEDWKRPDSLYRRLWEHLHARGMVAASPSYKRDLMKNSIDRERRAKRKKR